MKRCVLAASLFALLAMALAGCNPAAPAPGASAPQIKDIILATTTSTRDSGLLDVLIPDFQEKTGYRVKPIAVGTGQAMALGERGEADVLFVHAPVSERAFMAAGHGAERLLVMHNDFIVVGPESDPAGVQGADAAADALAAIAKHSAPFVSRGDNSGTHQLERQLWQAAGIEPQGAWYQEAGQGMAETLRIASEKDAYTICDRGTYLALRRVLALAPLVERDPALLNIYSVIPVDPAKNDRINAAGAKAWAEYLVSPAAQSIIESYGVDKYGEPLFFPDAGKREEELGGKGGVEAAWI